MYISEYNNSLIREPAILNLFSKDVYLAPLGYDEGTNDNSSGGEVVKLQKVLRQNSIMQKLHLINLIFHLKQWLICKQVKIFKWVLF